MPVRIEDILTPKELLDSLSNIIDLINEQGDDENTTRLSSIARTLISVMVVL
jgi:hypothetical protein